MADGTVINTIFTADTGQIESGFQRIEKSAKQFQKTSDNVASQSSKGFASIGKSATGAFSQITGGLGQIAPAAQSAVGGFQTMAAGASALNVALGPIGLILAAVVIAIKALMSYFKGTVDGAEKFAGIMGYLKGILMVVQDAFITLGKWIVWAFENPKEAIKELWEAIKQNIVNRWEGLIEFFKASFEFLKNGFKALWNLIKGIFNDEARAEATKYFDEMKKSLVDVGKAAVKISTGLDVEKIAEKGAAAMAEMKRVAEANAQIERELFQLRKSNIELSGKESAARREIAGLLADVKNTEEVSLADRIKALEQVKNLEFSIAEDKIKNAQKAVELQERQMKLSNNSIEDEEKLQELKNKVNQALTERDMKLREIYSQEKELKNLVARYGEEYINYTEREAKAAKAAADAKLKLEESLAAYKLERNKDTLEGDLAALKAQFDQKLMLEEEYQLRKADIEEKYRIKKLEEEKKAAEQAAAAAKEADSKELERLSTIANDSTNSYAERLDSYKSMLEKQLISQKEFDAAVKEMEQARNEQIAGFAGQALDAVSMMYEAAKNRELAAAGDNAQKREEIEKKYANKQKRVAILKAIINGALGITKAFAELGPIAGIIGAALISATTAAQIAVISSQSFAKGGIAYGEALATVGDYAGVRSNPEVIAPLDKLKTLMEENTGWGQVKFIIEQDALVGILSNANQKQIYF